MGDRIDKLNRVTLDNGAGVVDTFVDEEIICISPVGGGEGQELLTVVHRRHLNEVMSIAAEEYGATKSVPREKL